MIFSLSSRSVINSIYALAALDRSRAATAAADTDGILPDILCPDRLDALKILVKNEFSILVGSLFPLVTDCDVDSEDSVTDTDNAAAEWLMTMEIPAADTLAPGLGGAMRRTLEQLLAVRCLAAVYSLEGIDCPAQWDTATAMLADIRTALEGDATFRSAVIAPWSI